jgi:beta-phosphoglucomutase family hydrolase
VHEILSGANDAVVPEKMCAESVVIDRRRFDGAIFDLDGVLTDTARVHAAAWKATFDTFLESWAQRHGLSFKSFDIDADYFTYVDGRPRYDGIRTFLAARGIHLPEGSEKESDTANTVHALGERKTQLFRQALQKGIDPAPGAEVLLKKLRHLGVKTAMISSSKNATAVLNAAKIEHHFDVCVDGVDAEILALPGKPDPSLFLEATRRLGIRPSRAILFEDSLAGVEAGKRGSFGCVVGIDHGSRRVALCQRGADVVVKSLQEVHIEEN